jgi:hypothetical protein
MAHRILTAKTDVLGIKLALTKVGTRRIETG